MMGLFVSVMGTDCTNGGATSGMRNAVLVSAEHGIFEPRPDSPALVAVEDDGATGQLTVKRIPGRYDKGADLIVRVKACPVIDGEVKCGMFGGHYIKTTDSRFPYETPIPVYDRFETAEESYQLSR